MVQPQPGLPAALELGGVPVRQAGSEKAACAQSRRVAVEFALGQDIGALGLAQGGRARSGGVADVLLPVAVAPAADGDPQRSGPARLGQIQHPAVQIGIYIRVPQRARFGVHSRHLQIAPLRVSKAQPDGQGGRGEDGGTVRAGRRQFGAYAEWRGDQQVGRGGRVELAVDVVQTGQNGPGPEVLLDPQFVQPRALLLDLDIVDSLQGSGRRIRFAAIVVQQVEVDPGPAQTQQTVEIAVNNDVEVVEKSARPGPVARNDAGDIRCIDNVDRPRAGGFLGRGGAQYSD